MSERKIVVVSGGLSVPSSTRMLADALAQATVDGLAAQGIAAGTRVVELRDTATDVANNMVTGYAAPQLAAVLDEVTAADGLIAVSPVFTASYSGLFKSFFDVIDNKALEGKPVLLGATGGSSRHSMVLEHAMRPMFAYLRASVVPTAVYAAPEDWGDGESGVGGLHERVQRAGRELALLMENARPVRRADPNESLPFEQLLANISGS